MALTVLTILNPDVTKHYSSSINNIIEMSIFININQTQNALLASKSHISN